MSIVSHIVILYKNVYQNGQKLPKRDKLGINNKLENICLNCLKLSIKAVYTKTKDKVKILQKLKVEIEIIKHFLQLEFELEIIDNKNYFEIIKKTCEISKETNGWLKYLEKKESM